MCTDSCNNTNRQAWIVNRLETNKQQEQLITKLKLALGQKNTLETTKMDKQPDGRNKLCWRTGVFSTVQTQIQMKELCWSLHNICPKSVISHKMRQKTLILNDVDGYLTKLPVHLWRGLPFSLVIHWHEMWLNVFGLWIYIIVEKTFNFNLKNWLNKVSANLVVAVAL